MASWCRFQLLVVYDGRTFPLCSQLLVLACAVASQFTRQHIISSHCLPYTTLFDCTHFASRTSKAFIAAFCGKSIASIRTCDIKIMSDNLDHETTPSQGSAKSSASEELAQKALQALESIQKATPGPNAFAHAAKARVQHHIAGNAFAAQNRPSNTPALAAIHPALRAEAVVQATLMRAGSEPVFVHDSLLTTQEQAECANKPAVRPVTPSRDQAVSCASLAFDMYPHKILGSSTPINASTKHHESSERGQHSFSHPSSRNRERTPSIAKFRSKDAGSAAAAF